LSQSPVGPTHQVVHVYDEKAGESEDCRCTIGEDHDEDGTPQSEGLDVYDAADIWMSSGMDEDYTFGYSEDELRHAADQS
jgi:hypothetical protein